MAAGRGVRGSGLPAELTSFVGRRRESSEVVELLSDSRLVTLTGAAGMGKTRLALRVAARVARGFRDGVRLVELAPIADPALVAYAVAQALEIPEEDDSEPEVQLVRFLRNRQMLLVLDNCEHLAPACAALAHRLLVEADGLRILATSRHLLETVGEQVYPTPPLTVDAPGGGYGAAVDLFVHRAAAVTPGFALTADNTPHVLDVCRQLEGNPLAIELAAVLARVLAPAQLAARLSDRFRLLSGEARGRPAHHRTLRAAIEWSHQLCDPAEQRVWARASAFAGGFDLESAERVCAGDGIDPGDVLDLLDGLVAKSIVLFDATGPGRYRLLETLREFGAEKLREADDEAQVRRVHADHYLRLAEQGEREWFGPAQARWLSWARDEHDNLRIAYDFLLDAGGRGEAALRLATALWFDWMATARPLEGNLWLTRALSRVGDDSPGRPAGLWASSLAATLLGDVDAGRRLADQAWAAVRPGDPLTTARIVSRRAGVAVHHRDYTGAEELARDSLSRFAAAGAEADPMAVIALSTLAACRIALGDPAGAVAQCQAAEAICRARGDRSLLVLVLVFLARAEWSAGDLAAAAEHGRQAVLAARPGSARPYLVQAVDILAWISATSGDHDRAAVLLGAADTLWAEFGLHLLRDSPHFAVPRRECEKTSRAVLGEAAFAAAFVHGAGLGLDEVLAYATGRPAPGPTPTGDGPAAKILTRREHEIAGLVAQGLSNRRIAEKLVISPRTVESHVQRILTKLDFTSRSQIAAWTVGGQAGWS
ncbi:ATP-binding protein [Actinoplanes subtropicus]|uniref:ATP-binding protein n=1 Tax=Actinoplanes subtropicus TaxID=543632 RepID=UPI0004C2E0BC|nr:LuxR C-terminal-related transcriptional regulator [Actinoplanes subtropicus]